MEDSRSSLLKEKPPKGFLWSWDRLTKIQTTTRPENLLFEVWSKMGNAAQKKARQEWANEKPKLDNARRLRVFISSIRKVVNMKKPSKTQGESWKFQWRLQCLAKNEQKKRSAFQETEAKSDESNNIPKTKHACFAEAHESTRQRLESSLPKHHENHIAGK